MKTTLIIIVGIFLYWFSAYTHEKDLKRNVESEGCYTGWTGYEFCKKNN